MPPGGPHFHPPYGPPPPGYGPPGVPGCPGPGMLAGGYPLAGGAAGYGQPAVAGYGIPPGGGPAAGGVARPPGAPPGKPPGVGPAAGGFGAPAQRSAFDAGPTGVPGFGPPGVHGHAAHGSAAGGPPVVIDVGRTNARKAVIGATVAGAVGLLALVSGIAGAVDGGAGVGIVAIVIGLLFLVLPLGLVIRKDKIFRPQVLVFEPAGLRWHDPLGAPWLAPWSELAAVSISKHSPRQVGPGSVGEKLAGATADKLVGERAHVRIDLYPADPGFHGRHPEMAHLWERQGVSNGYRLPLGSNVRFIPVIASAMGRFAPRIYRGVNASEGFYGLS